MTTTVVPITITCPEWCEETAEDHAEVLWETGGCCDHASPFILAEDAAGYFGGPLEEIQQFAPIAVALFATTSPDGRPQASPLLQVDGREMTLRQGVELAQVLIHQTLTYLGSTEIVTVPDDGLLNATVTLLEELHGAAAALLCPGGDTQ